MYQASNALSNAVQPFQQQHHHNHNHSQYLNNFAYHEQPLAIQQHIQQSQHLPYQPNHHQANNFQPPQPGHQTLELLQPAYQQTNQYQQSRPPTTKDIATSCKTEEPVQFYYDGPKLNNTDRLTQASECNTTQVPSYFLTNQNQATQDNAGTEAPPSKTPTSTRTSDSLSIVLDEIGAIINGKDFKDLVGEQRLNQTTFNQDTARRVDNDHNDPPLAQAQQQQQTDPRQHQQVVSDIQNIYQTIPAEQDRQGLDKCHNQRVSLEETFAQTIQETMQPTSDNTMTENNHLNNQQQQQQQTYLLNPFDLPSNQNKLTTANKPFVEIVEQPAKCALRFRYKCEGRSAGSIPGVNSTMDSKTFPSIRICNYVGRAVVVISCVTKDLPYRAHPHNIVGKEGCKKGICTIVVNNETDTIRSFASLGIQCVKRKDIEESLSLRESINVDPFRNGFAHKLCSSNIDLNVVRLCFQVFIEGSTPNKCNVPLTPVVSDPIHDKKAMSDLVITKLSHCSAPATGGREVILLCDRISKDDIQIRFYEEKDGKLVWETYTELAPTDVHKQVAISFKTPKYYREDIVQPVMARIQLKRVSDNQFSEPRLFQFLPCESDEDIISRKRQKIDWVNNMNHHALDNILQPQYPPQAALQQQHQQGSLVAPFR